MGKKKKNDTPPQPQPAFALPEPHDDLFDWGGKLRDLRHSVPRVVDGEDEQVPVRSIFNWPDTMNDHFMLAEQFEAMCDQDKNLQITIRKALSAPGSPRFKDRLVDAVQLIFEEQYMVKQFELFGEIVDKVAEYLMAKQAHADLQQGEPTLAPPPDEN